MLMNENNSELNITAKELHRNTEWYLRVVFLIVTDLLIVALAKFGAMFLRFEFSFEAIEPRFYVAFQKEILPAMAISLVVFWVCGLYRSLWQYASVAECLRIFAAALISAILNILFNKATGIFMFRSYYVMGFMFIYMGLFASRFSYRFSRWAKEAAGLRAGGARGAGVSRVMVIGAGDSGNMIIREIFSRPDCGMKVVCIMDDDRTKMGKYIKGVRIVGGREQIREAAEEFAVDEIIIAIPSASPKNLSEILEICSQTGCRMKMLPNLSQIIDNGTVHLSELRSVKVEDLLGRDPVQVDLESVMAYVKNRVVAVTGGGGSIGSELCRQLVAHGPKKLVVIDIYENNIYDLQQELKRAYPEADVEYLIASVRDYDRLKALFGQYRPEILFHAAAHKHVPLMEDSPNEAIKNNVFGTYKTAKAAAECGVKRFVLISTDKAVNPTNIMGASKRICEMVIQQMDRTYDGTEFVAVRFGNVLASNGSVVKLFEKQIAEGGPVTVTHKDIVRYFMTIPEAVSLVLQAGAYARGGEIFVLDMGEQVKIDDLARNMIRLSGYVPDWDIPIVYTGLRPGEKLYEETLMAEEGMRDTPNRLIHIGRPIEMDYDRFVAQLKELEEACLVNAPDIAYKVSAMVPTYHISRELADMAVQGTAAGGQAGPVGTSMQEET